MKLAELKLLLINKVSESNHSQSDKNKLYEFIGDANELQTKQLLLFGTMQETINEQQEAIINEMFESDEVRQKLQEAKYREFEPKIKKFLKYGFAALVGAPLGVILPLAGMYLYRHLTDACVKKCGGLEATVNCKNLCYLNASKKTLAELQKQMSSINKLDDEKKKEKARKKLTKELAKWKERVEKYDERVRAGSTTYIAK